MKVNNTRVCLCAVLFTSFFTSTAIAQTSQVSNRGDETWTDFIDWGALTAEERLPYLVPYVPSPATLSSDDGVTVIMEQSQFYGVTALQPIVPPAPGAGFLNFQAGEFLYDTSMESVNDFDKDTITFSNFDGLGICGLGTQIAPIDPGSFTARIEAFDDSDASMGSYPVSGSTSDPEASFVGISSTEPMSSIEISIEGTEGRNWARYAINRVDLKNCESAVPQLSCDGFAAPMANHPVKAKKNRVFPLKMELIDENGFEQTDTELVAAPVIQVMFTQGDEGDAIDISDEVLSAGKGSDGNQFVFTNDDIWQFNLQSKNYSAQGTYLVTAVSGDESEYVINPSCVTSFIKD